MPTGDDHDRAALRLVEALRGLRHLPVGMMVRSLVGTVREFVSISIDALLAAWFGNLAAYTGLLPTVSSLAHSLKKGSNLVLESNEASTLLENCAAVVSVAR